ncbi:hypothetical protein K461DRAFT_21900 [Myriangium duriaei CBS 260.36]|uniref:Uncharacterized protein n=1 Tax=Myriangium duriaei CBS 260.36 TaxID=1168546 RepID=A0A9P4JF03_9PEZI|nr:hypothetical protein K461DRAFT_21900 [Myriangium duriaei CBS 260.36]
MTNRTWVCSGIVVGSRCLFECDAAPTWRRIPQAPRLSPDQLPQIVRLTTLSSISGPSKGHSGPQLVRSILQFSLCDLYSNLSISYSVRSFYHDLWILEATLRSRR